jgi:hypothetical protein
VGAAVDRYAGTLSWDRTVQNIVPLMITPMFSPWGHR